MDDPTSPAKARSVEGAARPRRARPQWQPTPSAPISIFVHGLLLAAVSATVFLAAGPAQGSLGIFLLAAGVALTFCPARVKVEWPLWFCAAGLLGCGALAFLPARWFPAPAWRTTLGSAPAIHLPSTVTPVPWETGFWLGLLGLSFLTGLFLLAHPIRSRTLLWLAAAAVMVCGVYAALSIYAKQAGWHYPFEGGATFGFFPNRNHTATFLVTGSILALGVLTVGLREGRWTFSALVTAAMTACVAGLFFYSGSRAGVIFLIVGTLLWVVGLGSAHRSMPLVVSVVALAVSAGLLFVVSGGEARARLFGANASPTASSTLTQANANPPSGEAGDSAPDFRMLIYRDAYDLIRDAPVTGTGLGAFASVFTQYRQASLTPSTAVHPESDWLMVAAEAGAPALIFILAACVLLLLRLRGAGDHPYWPLRWACVAAAVAAVLHGVVDVPVHRVALGWWLLVLAGLGAQAEKVQNQKSSWPQKFLFVGGGLAALTLGTLLIRAEWFGGRPLPPFVASRDLEEILALSKRGEHWAAMEKAQQATRISPLAPLLYYQLGLATLHFEDSDREVDEAFQAQRLLNPVWSGVPLLQGYAWLPIAPKKTAALWREALACQIRVDHTRGSAAAYYRSLIEYCREWPEVQRELVSEVDRGPEFLLAWSEGASSESARTEWPKLITRTTLLERLTPEQHEKFLSLWYAKGSRDDLEHFLEDNPAWRESAWPMRLREMIDAQRYEKAVRATAEHYRVSLEVLSHFTPPTDTELGDERIKSFKSAWSAGDNAAARRILEGPGDPPAATAAQPEYWRLKMALAVADHDWPRAWEYLKTCIRLTHPSASLP